MFDLSTITIFLTGFLFGFFFFNRITTNQVDLYLASYHLSKNFIKELVDIFFQSQVLPQTARVDHEFKAEDLEALRNQCIEFVINEINNSRLKKLVKKTFSETSIIYFTDYYFTQKAISLRGVKV